MRQDQPPPEEATTVSASSLKRFLFGRSHAPLLRGRNGVSVLDIKEIIGIRTP
jgi:hypothetical protein